MNKSNFLQIAFAPFCFFLFNGIAFGAGALDWADPCVDIQKKFASNGAAAKVRADQTIKEWDSRIEPPGELRGLYVEAIREGAFKAWSGDPTATALINALKQANAKFNPHIYFVTEIYPKVVTADKEAEYVRTLYKTDYQAKLRPQLLAARSDLDKANGVEKTKLDAACKPDVVSQILRGTIGNALLILGNNWSAAQNEKGDVAKYFRATSGISITDIQQYGIQGGPNSELNKIMGGENSAARAVIKALDPSQWNIVVPEIGTPIVNPIPSVTIPGTTIRVCIPWC